MARRRRRSGEDERFRVLLVRAEEETSLRHVVKEAGIESGSGYMAIYRWYLGRRNRSGGESRPPLRGENREKLFAYLLRRFRSDLEAVDKAEELAKLAKLARIATRVPSEGTRKWFAEILRKKGCTEIKSFEVRAGDNYVYLAAGGLTEEDYEAFAPALEGLDQEELRRMVDENKERRRG
ncbi:MAG: hypothetical protein JWN86_1409 [Planctomycetota bacterium]|nr:hypothetical protein [Planctomycetota bacterium]